MPVGSACAVSDRATLRVSIPHLRHRSMPVMPHLRQCATGTLVLPALPHVQCQIWWQVSQFVSSLVPSSISITSHRCFCDISFDPPSLGLIFGRIGSSRVQLKSVLLLEQDVLQSPWTRSYDGAGSIGCETVSINAFTLPLELSQTNCNLRVLVPECAVVRWPSLSGNCGHGADWKLRPTMAVLISLSGLSKVELLSVVAHLRTCWLNWKLGTFAALASIEWFWNHPSFSKFL